MDGLTVAYGAVVAIRDVSLEVAPGGIVAALGPNGAGKTTLLRALAGALKPQHGSVTFDGDALTGLVARRRASAAASRSSPRAGTCSPSSRWTENLTIGGDRAQAIARRCAPTPTGGSRGSRSWANARTSTAGTLSGGEQQQLAIARALMARPRMLLLDEPSLGLAPIFVDRIFELIQELRDEGVTVLLVEQNVHRALEIAERAYVLSVGAVVASGPDRPVWSEGELERSYLGISQTR